MNKYLIRLNVRTGRYEYLSGVKWKSFESCMEIALLRTFLGSEVNTESYSYYYGPIKRPMKHSRDFSGSSI